MSKCLALKTLKHRREGLVLYNSEMLVVYSKSMADKVFPLCFGAKCHLDISTGFLGSLFVVPKDILGAEQTFLEGFLNPFVCDASWKMQYCDLLVRSFLLLVGVGLSCVFHDFTMLDYSPQFPYNQSTSTKKTQNWSLICPYN